MKETCQVLAEPIFAEKSENARFFFHTLETNSHDSPGLTGTGFAGGAADR
jgi:hypothetical protein